MTQALPAVWYAKKLNVPHIIYVMDLWPENVQAVANIKNGFLLNRIDDMVNYIYEKSSLILASSSSFVYSIAGRGIEQSKIKFWPQYAEELYRVKDSSNNEVDVQDIKELTFVFAQVGNQVKSIAITSNMPMDGKSTTSANLAYTMAQTGRNVLIVDSDLRKPTVHRTFKLNNELGLTTLLANPELKFNQVVQKSKELGLYFLPSGPMPPNSAELMGSPQMARLMQELSNNFDMVIYDTPPVNSVTDAQIIATRVDGVILVARQNYARKDQVREAKEALENVKANLLGFVVNNVPFEEGKGYGYGYGYGLEDDEV